MIKISVSDFSLSQWKMGMEISTLTERDSYLLQEDLKIAQYLRMHSCSRESEDYIPQSYHWKDGNFFNVLKKEIVM
jgi:hypothetical protein